MGDYRDVVRTAIELGFYLDSCGTDERHYTWGSWVDLCGMSVEDAIIPDEGDSGGGDSTKTKNTITFLMQKGADGEYALVLNAEKAPNADVVVSFTMDGTTNVVTIPAGTTSFNTGLKGEDPSKPYATITGIAISSDDEQYSYKSKNSVKTGVFTLTINNNGVTTTEQVKYGEPVTLPTAPEKEGYDFVWKDGNGNVIEGNEYIMPEANATITGTYVAKKYVLTYIVKEQVLNGDSVSESVISTKTAQITFGTKIWNTIKNETPSRTGYTLDGWKSADGPVNSGTTMPAKDFEVSNLYKLNKYTLRFVADGVDVLNEQKYFGQEISAPEIPSKTGYNTIGWNAEVPATMPAANKTFTAVYEAIIYKIRYFVDGNEISAYTEDHIYGDSISIRADESKEGYTFSGWNPSELPATMPDEDIDIEGTFTINTYHFTLYVDGEVYFEKDYEYGETIDKSEIADPEKEGYTFTGWNPEIPDTVPSSDVEIYAMFDINQYDIKYYVDDVLYSSITLDYGTELSPIDEPEKEGYTFSGWSEIPATMPVGGVRVDGTFTINEYQLTYYVDGEVYSSLTVQFAEEIEPIDEPEREGYTFSGWDEVPSVMPSHDVDVNGEFTVNTWEIRYYVDGEIYQSEEHDYGEEIQIAPNPDDRTGYTFSGWTYDEFPATMPDHDIEVYGTFEVNQYTLDFVLDGEPYSSMTLDYGTEISAPEVAPVTGYTFSGWNPEVPDTVPAEDMTFSGSMVINSWVATYYIDDEVYTAMTYQYGAEIQYPDVPKEGFVLKWNKEYETMPDNDINVTGIYEEIVESKTIYYGAVPDTGITDFDDYESLSTYEYENGVEATKTFVIPGDPEWEEAQYYNTRKKNAWMAAHKYDLYLMAPENASVSFANEFGPLDETILDNDFEIDGNAYKAHYVDGTSPETTDAPFDIKITVTKN